MNEGALIIKTDESVTPIVPVNGGDFTLEELQKHVGGRIEIVRLTDQAIMVINEEGKDALPLNPMATVMAKATCSIFPWDYIAGDVVMCHTDMVK